MKKLRQIFKKILEDKSCFVAYLRFIQEGRTQPWRSIVEDTALRDEKELYLALRTSINALTSGRRDLAQILEDYCRQHRIQIPMENFFDDLTLRDIWDAASSMECFCMADEFLSEIECHEKREFDYQDFRDRFQSAHYILLDEELLFSLEWDHFFYTISGEQPQLQKFVQKYAIEGSQDELPWD